MGSLYNDNIGVGGNDVDPTTSNPPNYPNSLVAALLWADGVFFFDAVHSTNSVHYYSVTYGGNQPSIGTISVFGDFGSGGTQKVTSVSGFGSTITLSGNAQDVAFANGETYWNSIMGSTNVTFTNPETGNVYDAEVIGDGGRNDLRGGPGTNYIVGGGGADALSGGDGNDTIRLYYGDYVSGENINGGRFGNSDTIEVQLNTNPGPNDIDFTIGSFAGIEILRYIPTFRNSDWVGNNVTLSAGQAATLQGIRGSVNTNTHTGAVAVDTLTITLAQNVDLSTLSFTDWTVGVDTVTIQTVGNNFLNVTGTIENDLVQINGTSGFLKSWDGNDTIIFASGITATGVSIDGGNGTDTVKVQSDNIDFSSQQLVNTESLVYASGNSTVAVSSQQLAAGNFHNITGSAGTDAFVVNVGSDGTPADLSGLVFTSWTDGVDTITINGRTLSNTLTGSSHADIIKGDASNDTINGGAGNDIITGGAGAGVDTLTGGPGNDTFVLLHPGDGVKTITDFTPGQDMLQLSASGFGLAAGSLAHAGVSFVLGTAATAATPTIVYDSNSGNIFWDPDGTGGQAQVLLANVTEPHVASDLGGNTDWKMVATGDFNHDGTSDVIWRSDSTGADLMWFMANGQMTQTIAIGGNTDWQVAATGDFNHDGTTDIIWRSSSSGTDLLWTMGPNGQPTTTTNIGGNLDWKPVATGDFNHDGTTEVIWGSNSSGQDLLWLMNNGQMTQTINLGGNTDWTPSATGDFNHDGTTDIVWRSNASGQDLLWIMGNNGQPTSTINLGGNLDWRPVASGDFNHDGTSDIVWRSTSSGQNILWTMSNGQPVTTQVLRTDLNVQPAGTGDFNHDGTSDIIWTDATTGADVLWSMGNPALTAAHFTIA